MADLEVRLFPLPWSLKERQGQEGGRQPLLLFFLIPLLFLFIGKEGSPW
jgi:hypothetical protein